MYTFKKIIVMMNSKRKVSKVDERILRENEYIGRVLNERVKELDKLKGKFERKLQQEKERFAVRHLSVTSNFNERKGLKKKISLAFDSKSCHSPESQDIAKNRSGSLFSNKELGDDRDSTKVNCLFPPIDQNRPRLSVYRRKTISFTEGMLAESERRYQRNSPESTSISADNLPKWQRDLIDENRKAETMVKQRVNDGQTQEESWENESIQLTSEYPSCCFDTESNVGDSQSDSSLTMVVKDRRERRSLSQNDGKKLISGNRNKQPRSRKLSYLRRNDDATDVNLDMNEEDTDIDMDGIGSVNMVKNLTKQQRLNLEHKVTFLPPMGCKFREDTSNDSIENEMDSKRLVMARNRWLKAYNIAKANFKGKGPTVQESPIQELTTDESIAPQECTKDPRLLELVSILSRPGSLQIGNDSVSRQQSGMM